MNDPRLLGGFEQAVLLSLLRLGESSYAVPVRTELCTHLGREVSRGALYTALDRLEARGLVRSRLGEPTPERGGRAKRHYAVTASGVAALRGSKSLLEGLWRDLDRSLGNAR